MLFIKVYFGVKPTKTPQGPKRFTTAGKNWLGKDSLTDMNTVLLHVSLFLGGRKGRRRKKGLCSTKAFNFIGIQTS